MTKEGELRHFRWKIFLVLSFTLSSMFIYGLEILIFQEPKNTFQYFFQDLAFVPLQVLLVTLFMDQVLAHREKRSLREKLYMTIGIYFSESGLELLRLLTRFDADRDHVIKELLVDALWTEKQFKIARKNIKNYMGSIRCKNSDLNELRSYLKKERPFMLTLINNPHLMENQSLTDTLWSILHLGDELSGREKERELPESDLEHLAVDIHRAYVAMLGEWITYMEHLKTAYPFLFSLAVRKNPFVNHASIVVR